MPNFRFNPKPGMLVRWELEGSHRLDEGGEVTKGDTALITKITADYQYLLHWSGVKSKWSLIGRHAHWSLVGREQTDV